MTGTITLLDDEQNYIEFFIACDVVESVKPSMLSGWVGTKILNTKYTVGGKLTFDLQWRDFNPTLEQPIVSIDYTDIPGSEWLRENMTSEKHLYPNPRDVGDLMMYGVDCEDFPLYFGCVNTAAVAAVDALMNFDKIPLVLLEDINGVMLFDSIKPGRPQTIADIGHYMMVIYNNYIVDYGIITHEATHAWAYDKWGQYEPPWDTDYYKVCGFSTEEAITDYGSTDYAEDLAEGVRYYVFDPPYMKKMCPERYAIIERMMTDPSYYG